MVEQAHDRGPSDCKFKYFVRGRAAGTQPMISSGGMDAYSLSTLPQILLKERPSFWSCDGDLSWSEEGAISCRSKCYCPTFKRRRCDGGDGRNSTPGLHAARCTHRTVQCDCWSSVLAW